MTQPIQLSQALPPPSASTAQQDDTTEKKTEEVAFQYMPPHMSSNKKRSALSSLPAGSNLKIVRPASSFTQPRDLSRIFSNMTSGPSSTSSGSGNITPPTSDQSSSSSSSSTFAPNFIGLQVRSSMLPTKSPQAARAIPSLTAFLTGPDHREYQEARGLSTSSKITPDTPAFVDPRTIEKYDRLPLIQHAKALKTLLAQKLSEKKEGTFKPFELEIKPELRVVIEDVSFLSNKGRHNDVYLCSVRGMGQWVLKLYKDELLYRQPNIVVTNTATQLQRYRQNMGHEILRNHTAQFLNFDRHLPVIKEMDFAALKRYVSNHIDLSFSFVPYVPNPFPLDFDQEASAWKQLKAIFAASVDSKTINDLRWSNMRINDQDVVQQIDLFELDQDEDSMLPFIEELRSTFTNNAEHQKWICPHIDE